MLATSEEYLDRLLDPVGRLLSSEVAQRLVELRADPLVQTRLDELADQAGQGTLTPQDAAEYETYIQAIEFIAVLQAKARARLASRVAV